MDIENRVGQRIAQLRKDKDLVQKELAFKAGISRSSLSDVENGTISITLKTLQKIADALGEHPEDLLR